MRRMLVASQKIWSGLLTMQILPNTFSETAKEFYIPANLGQNTEDSLQSILEEYWLLVRMLLLLVCLHLACIDSNWHSVSTGKSICKSTSGQQDHEPRCPSTFQDILPPSLITTSSLSKDSEKNSPPGLRSQQNRLKDLVQKAALPKMHSVVENAKRSFLAHEKPASTTTEIDDERQNLVRQGSNSGTLYRTDTTSSNNSICSAVSTITPITPDNSSLPSNTRI